MAAPRHPTRVELAEQKAREGEARRAMHGHQPRRWPSPVRVGAVIFALRHLPR